MNEKPILFSGEMVRAILAGRKMQTRRVIRLPDFRPGEHFDEWMFRDKKGRWVTCSTSELISLKCPYGEPGDVLWVRETWAKSVNSVIYRADWSNPEADEIVEFATGETVPLVWRPSIFMPHSISRITLEIVNVRAERVQEISEGEAIAEGIEQKEPNHVTSAQYRFVQLWNSINAKRDYGWDANPWVWVVEFKVIKPILDLCPVGGKHNWQDMIVPDTMEFCSKCGGQR